MKLGCILPVHNEEQNIPLLYERLCDVVRRLNVEYEFLFVNDGSTDGTMEQLFILHALDPHIRILDLSRNFWHEVSLKAGLDHIDGDAIVIMDTDLQDPPETIIPLFQKLQEGYDIVSAQRSSRSDGYGKDITAHLFYRRINKVSEMPIPLDTWNFRIFTRQVLEEVRRFHEQSRFIRGIFARMWMKTTSISFEREKRVAGKTWYSPRKMLWLSLDALFWFSVIPLRMATLLGGIFSLFGFILGIYYIIEKLISPDHRVRGIPTLVVLICFMGGIQLMIMGILGEYIARVYKETKQRPLYIIKKLY